MNPSEELRWNAAECFRLADSTADPKDKARWRRMAESWLEMARRAEPPSSRQEHSGK
jgi:hypothetical protein